MLRFGFYGTAAAVWLAAVGTGPAQAVLTIKITQTTGAMPFLSVADGSTDDADGVVNDSVTVKTSAITGTFTTLTAGSSFTSNFVSTATQSFLNNTTRLVRTGGGAASFTVSASRDGVTIPGDPGKTLSGSGSGNFNGGTSVQSFVIGADGADMLHVISTPVPITPTGPFPSPAAFAFDGTPTMFLDTNPFSLTNSASYSTTSASMLQSTSSVVASGPGAPAVPAPAGLVLAAAAAPAFGLRRLLRRKSA